MNIQVAKREQFEAEADRLLSLLAPHDVMAAAQTAMRRIAPVWPLKDFVAVNPFLGLSGEAFADAAARLNYTGGARTIMPRAFFLEAIKTGRIADEDISAALKLLPANKRRDLTPDGLKRALHGSPHEVERQVPLVADIASDVTGTDWLAIMRDRMSHWAASYFDDGQAVWVSHQPGTGAFVSWKAYAVADRTPDVQGAGGFSKAVAALPSDPEDVLALCANRLGLDQTALEDHFHALLMVCGGWASYARYELWQAELKGGSDSTMLEVLAALAGWEIALLDSLGRRVDMVQPWGVARDATSRATAPDFSINAIAQSAYEIAWQRQCVADLENTLAVDDIEPKPLQVAFCIDVRSEVFRRALECTSADIETIGFAGFFGVPLSYLPAGEEEVADQCPVLLNPGYVIAESDHGADLLSTTERRRFLRAITRAWKSFKISAVSSFSFVETFGWSYAAKLATDTLGLTRPVTRGSSEHGMPCLHETKPGTGIAPDDQIALAENILRGMSLTQRLGRLVLLAGHGASVVNNPHAAGLDCGACGGHPGDVNARVAAAILNNPDVRRALAERGIEVSSRTHFIAGLHDTTTDKVRLFDEAKVPATHKDDLAELKTLLAHAGEMTRSERAGPLGLSGSKHLHADINRRTRDWSQVRPEWGLAGCAGFIAAPRHRTAGIDLGGRAFLHSYDWREDKDFAVLELIMTAPMVVASWINLQYYGSTVDNRAFGAGNKVLHNVVGTFGVLEGAGGDLRTGLPMQSLHDGEKLIHEPMRLSVFIAAPTSAIDDVLDRHVEVKALVENGWLHLFAMGEENEPTLRWTGTGQWRAAIPARNAARALAKVAA